MVVLQNESVKSFSGRLLVAPSPRKVRAKANAFSSQPFHSNDEINDGDVCHLHRRWLGRKSAAKKEDTAVGMRPRHSSYGRTHANPADPSAPIIEGHPS